MTQRFVANLLTDQVRKAKASSQSPLESSYQELGIAPEIQKINT